jgi:phenylacetate-CoA ligase
MDISTRDPLEYMALLNAKRFEKLKKQIRYCFGNADYYRQRFLEAGVDSPDAIDSLDAFRRLPAFLDKARHRESQQRSLVARTPIRLHSSKFRFLRRHRGHYRASDLLRLH